MASLPKARRIKTDINKYSMPPPVREGDTLTSGQQGLTRLLLVNGRMLSRNLFSQAPVTLRWKRKMLRKQRRNLKTLAFCSRVYRKYFERPHDNDVISLPEFF